MMQVYFIVRTLSISVSVKPFRLVDRHVDPKLVALLKTEQVQALRRALGLGPKSIVAVLFTETGVLPIEYRRVKLALKYLRYLVQLPENQYAAAAYRDSLTLLDDGKPCWLGDLTQVLINLPVPIRMYRYQVTSVEGVDSLLQLLDDSCATFLHDLIEQSHRVPLLHKRVPHTTIPRLGVVAKFRDYLVDVTVGDHRMALTRLLCGSHCLAVEELRHRTRTRELISRERRLCRFCRVQIEDEPHALLHCAQVPLSIKIRKVLLLRKAEELVPEEDWSKRHEDPYDDIRPFLKYRSLTPAFASYVFHVLRTFGDTQIFFM